MRTSNFIGLSLIVIILFSGSGAVATTPPERADDETPLTVGIHPLLAPFESFNRHREAIGISVDLLKLAAKKCGLQLRFVPTTTFDETLELARRGKIDLVNSVNETADRAQPWLFTEPFLIDPNVIVTRANHAYIGDLSLTEKQVAALPRSSARTEFIRKFYPNVKIIYVEDNEAAVRLVAEGKADLTIKSMMTASALMVNEAQLNLKISGYLPPQYNSCLRVGITDDNPNLRARLNQGINAITAAERRDIIGRYLQFMPPTNYYFAIGIAVSCGLLLIIASGFIWRLRRYNAALTLLAQTDRLTGLNNRVRIDECAAKLREIAERYQRSFAIIMLDIDFFKCVNDESGHQMGDRILIAIAQNIVSAIRNVDSAGRWGGEEFIVLCPETTAEEVGNVAERIRETVESSIYPDGKIHTVSIGVAAWRRGESIEKLIARADTALYQAKRGGRNRVVLS